MLIHKYYQNKKINSKMGKQTHTPIKSSWFKKSIISCIYKPLKSKISIVNLYKEQKFSPSNNGHILKSKLEEQKAPLIKSRMGSHRIITLITHQFNSIIKKKNQHETNRYFFFEYIQTPFEFDISFISHTFTVDRDPQSKLPSHNTDGRKQ